LQNSPNKNRRKKRKSFRNIVGVLFSRGKGLWGKLREREKAE